MWYYRQVGTKKKVLVVDDEACILRFTSANLTLEGYDVITADGGAEALELAKNEHPDIMLLDVLMSPLTGFDVLVRLREFSQMPVIVFTARNDVGNLAIKEGANGFIAKPFKIEELNRRMKSAFADEQSTPA